MALGRSLDRAASTSRLVGLRAEKRWALGKCWQGAVRVAELHLRPGIELQLGLPPQLTVLNAGQGLRHGLSDAGQLGREALSPDAVVGSSRLTSICAAEWYTAFLMLSAFEQLKVARSLGLGERKRTLSRSKVPTHPMPAPTEQHGHGREAALAGEHAFRRSALWLDRQPFGDQCKRDH